jgi:hypothetical protein
MRISRRGSLKASASALVLGTVGRVSLAAQDPLPSWNDGPAKKAILDFLHATIDRMSAKFVPEPERIATLDQDGTLWIEHPMYSQVVYCFDRLHAITPALGLPDTHFGTRT